MIDSCHSPLLPIIGDLMLHHMLQCTPHCHILLLIHWLLLAYTSPYSHWVSADIAHTDIAHINIADIAHADIADIQ